MITFLKKYWLIIIILFLAIFLRFWNLGSYPALNADEAAIGYNAYSLILTGHDEHGNPWPIHFQSFNDYKPGLYFYIVLPFVKFLGLNPWAVRIPGAAIGVLSVLLIFLLSKELFENKRVAYVSALFLAISPWHIQYSRGGWEVNTATFFVMLGMLMFLKAVKKPGILNFTYSAIPFVLSLYTYHAARVIVPLLLVFLAVSYRKQVFVKSNIKILIVSVFIGIAAILPLAKDLISPGALSRVAGVGLFADPGPRNRINEQRGEHGDVGSVLGKVMHNKAVNYGLAFINNWASHFHGEFLFMSGDSIQRNKVPETGEMYLFDIVFLIIGLFTIVRNFLSASKQYSLIIFWILIAPVASALTFQSPNALRAQNMVVPLVLISSMGFVQLTDWINEKKKLIKISSFVILVCLIVWNFARYQHMYWVHMSKEYPYSSQYGVPELVNYLKDNGGSYRNIVVTDRYDQPYILFLFFLNYPPQNFQGHHELSPRDQFGFSTVRDFDKYRFEAINFDKIRTQFTNSLIVGTPSEIPKEANVVKRIFGSNGYEYFDIVAN